MYRNRAGMNSTLGRYPTIKMVEKIGMKDYTTDPILHKRKGIQYSFRYLIKLRNTAPHTQADVDALSFK